MIKTLERLAPIWTPHSGQREFLMAPNSVKVLACGRRWGKSDACAVEVIHSLLQRSPRKVLLLAPTLAQARIVFDRVVDLYSRLTEREGLAEMKLTQTPHPQIRAGPHVVRARSGHCGRFLRGTEATHLVLDEAAYLPEALITEVAMPMLATTEGTLTLLSTPSGRNHFWRFFDMGLRGEHGLWSRRSPSSENPLVSQRFLELQREIISDRAFRVEYEAEFADSDDQVFSTAAIDGLFVRQLSHDPAAPYVIGIDWARSYDATAVVVMQGQVDRAAIVHVEHLRGLSWREQVERVAEVLRRYPNARVLGDGTGVGDPVNSMLAEICPTHVIEQLHFTALVKQQLVEQLAVALDRGRVQALAHPELQRELTHFAVTPSRSGSSSYGARSGYHDDLVIAFALAVRLLPAASSQLQVWTSGRNAFRKP